MTQGADNVNTDMELGMELEIFSKGVQFTFK